jgi:hypothetical protein
MVGVSVGEGVKLGRGVCVGVSVSLGVAEGNDAGVKTIASSEPGISVPVARAVPIATEGWIWFQFCCSQEPAMSTTAATARTATIASAGLSQSRRRGSSHTRHASRPGLFAVPQCRHRTCRSFRSAPHWAQMRCSGSTSAPQCSHLIGWSPFPILRPTLRLLGPHTLLRWPRRDSCSRK